MSEHKHTFRHVSNPFCLHEQKVYINFILSSVVHLFPWTNILDENLNLSDTFRVPDPKTGQMRRLISQISENEEQMFRNMLTRLNHIITVADSLDVRIMIDAEQTYFQPAISRICLEMMRKYNKVRGIIGSSQT